MRLLVVDDDCGREVVRETEKKNRSFHCRKVQAHERVVKHPMQGQVSSSILMRVWECCAVTHSCVSVCTLDCWFTYTL